MVMHKDKIKKSKSKIYLSDPNPGFTFGVYCGSVFYNLCPLLVHSGFTFGLFKVCFGGPLFAL